MRDYIVYDERASMGDIEDATILLAIGEATLDDAQQEAHETFPNIGYALYSYGHDADGNLIDERLEHVKVAGR